MSTEKLDEYKRLYSEYIELAVTVHNYHNVFMHNVGIESGKAVRTSLSKMILIEKRLVQLSKAAHREKLENIKEERALLKIKRANARERKMPKGRPKGTGNGNYHKST